MPKEMKIEIYKENIVNGIYVGMILLLSTFLVIRFSNSQQLWENTMKYMVAEVFGYLAIGIYVNCSFF